MQRICFVAAVGVFDTIALIGYLLARLGALVSYRFHDQPSMV